MHFYRTTVAALALAAMHWGAPKAHSQLTRKSKVTLAVVPTSEAFRFPRVTWSVERGLIAIIPEDSLSLEAVVRMLALGSQAVKTGIDTLRSGDAVAFRDKPNIPIAVPSARSKQIARGVLTRLQVAVAKPLAGIGPARTVEVTIVQAVRRSIRPSLARKMSSPSSK